MNDTRQMTERVSTAQARHADVYRKMIEARDALDAAYLAEAQAADELDAAKAEAGFETDTA